MAVVPKPFEHAFQHFHVDGLFTEPIKNVPCLRLRSLRKVDPELFRKMTICSCVDDHLLAIGQDSVYRQVRSNVFF